MPPDFFGEGKEVDFQYVIKLVNSLEFIRPCHKADDGEKGNFQVIRNPALLALWLIQITGVLFTAMSMPGKLLRTPELNFSAACKLWELDPAWTRGILIKCNRSDLNYYA